MKEKIHPKYNPKTKVICSCGNNFEVGSTKEEIRVEVCSSCHPFYTGTAKFIDTAGRVDRFRAKMQRAEEFKTQHAAKPQPVTKTKENKSEK